MKKAKLLAVAVLIMAGVILVGGGQALAGNSSIELGEKLFNDPTLGGSTNDKSCNSCHPDGEGLEKAGDNDKLPHLINRCISGPLGGEKIDDGSAEMTSLKMYIESLSGK